MRSRGLGRPRAVVVMSFPLSADAEVLLVPLVLSVAVVLGELWWLSGCDCGVGVRRLAFAASLAARA